MPDRMQTKRIRLYGIVQGVGFRPFVSRAAMDQGILGSVCNRGSYVEVIARGSEEKRQVCLCRWYHIIPFCKFPSLFTVLPAVP